MEDPRKNHVSFDREIAIGDLKVTSAAVREPLVEDELQAVAEAQQEAEAAGLPVTQAAIEARLLAILSGLPYAGIRKMRSAEYRKLQGGLLGFFSSTPSGSTGGQSPLAGSPATG